MPDNDTAAQVLDELQELISRGRLPLGVSDPAQAKSLPETEASLPVVAAVVERRFGELHGTFTVLARAFAGSRDLKGAEGQLQPFLALYRTALTAIADMDELFEDMRAQARR